MPASETENPQNPAEKSGKEARNISSIVFPYYEMGEAIEIVRTIHEKGGGVSCSPDLLAAAMKQVPTSGTFRLKVSAARIFGLIGTSAGKVTITDLGYEITDPIRERAAKVQAFLNVELYRRVYEDFKGKQLPPRPAAFELMLERLGVSPKQKDRARIALDKSAQMAGFYDHGRERLVMPNVDGLRAEPEQAAREPEATHEDEHRSRRRNGGNDGDGGGRHPFIQGLLQTLPEPETTWMIEGRAKWLQAAANIFDLIYKGDGTITVSAAPAKSE